MHKQKELGNKTKEVKSIADDVKKAQQEKFAAFDIVHYLGLKSMCDLARLAVAIKAMYILHFEESPGGIKQHVYTIPVSDHHEILIFELRLSEKEKLLGTYLLARINDEEEKITCGFKAERNYRAFPIIDVIKNEWEFI